MEQLGWGILGTGRIAAKFADDLVHAAGAELIAVGSRSQSRADDFGRRYGIPHRHGSYTNLYHDPDVDLIYVATPHPGHAPCTIAALRAGKAVLCEKPFAVNARQAREMVCEAREHSLFLMEGMWTRFLPCMVFLRAFIEKGGIGRLLSVEANFGFASEFRPQSRLYARELAGGALLDVGVYPVSLCQALLGTPDQIQSWAKIGATGVDEQCAALLGYRDGGMGCLHAAIRHRTSQDAWICGDGGRIRIHAPWWRSQEISIWHGDAEEPEVRRFPFEGYGYQYEAMECMRCIREGLLENPAMSWTDSEAVMVMLDRIRGKWGLRYQEDWE